MRTMTESVALAIEELGDPAGLGDGRLEELVVHTEVDYLDVDEGPWRYQLEDLEPIEVMAVWCRFKIRAGASTAKGGVPLGTYRRAAGSDDGWRDQASTRWDVLGAVSGFLLGEGVCRDDVVAALRSLEETDSHLLTSAP